MNHNHIYSDSVSWEQLKAVDIISKKGHVCPTSPLTPPKKNKQQTNEKYTNIVQPCNITS